jgi:hypothetical protein
MSNAIFECPDLNVLSGLNLHSGEKMNRTKLPRKMLGRTISGTIQCSEGLPGLMEPWADEEKESQGQLAGPRVAGVRRGLSDTAMFYLITIGDQGFVFIWRGNGAK